MGVKHRKAKGKYLENEVADKFIKLKNLSESEVHRSQSSGTFKTDVGDIWFKEYAIIIECKNQNSINFSSFIPSLNKNIFSFYNQLKKEEEKFTSLYGTSQLLSFLVLTDSSKRMPRFVLIDIDNLSRSKIDLKQIKFFMKTCYGDNEFFVFELNEFISVLNIDLFKVS